MLLASDHGWKLGEHGAWSKHTLFEADTRVPLIVRLPAAAAAAAAAGGVAVGRGALPRGVAARGVVELLDVMPSLLELAGLRQPAEQPGDSAVLMAPQLTDLASWGGLSKASGCATHSGRAAEPLMAERKAAMWS